MRLLAEIALIALAALAVSGCVLLVPRAAASRRRRAAPPEPARPAQLVALERLVSGAGASAVHVHAYLRPVLAEIASRRLAVRGQRLDRISDPVGRELFGEGLWELIRPDRPFPEHRHGPGVRPQELSGMLETLERL